MSDTLSLPGDTKWHGGQAFSVTWEKESKEKVLTTC